MNNMLIKKGVNMIKKIIVVAFVLLVVALFTSCEARSLTHNVKVEGGNVSVERGSLFVKKKDAAVETPKKEPVKTTEKSNE